MWDCSEFKALDVTARANKVLEIGACGLCLSWAHQRDACDAKVKRPCNAKEGTADCGKLHHKLLHGNTFAQLNAVHITWDDMTDMKFLLHMTYVHFPNKIRGLVFLDDGSTHCLITHRFAKFLGLVGHSVTLYMRVTGKEFEKVETKLYEIEMEDNDGNIYKFPIIGINQITSQALTLTKLTSHPFKRCSLMSLWELWSALWGKWMC